MMLKTCSFHKNVALDVKVWELMVDDLGGKWGFCRFERLQVRAFAFFARFFTSSKKQFRKELPHGAASA